MKRPSSEAEYAKHWAADEELGPAHALALNMERFRLAWFGGIGDLPHPEFGIAFLRVLRSAWRLIQEWNREQGVSENRN